jgi:hypothetical protein
MSVATGFWKSRGRGSRTQLPGPTDCGTIVRMRLSEVSWADSELPAGGLPAGDRSRLITAPADQPGRADRPDGRGSLAERLARLPDAHPSAWSPVAQSADGQSADGQSADGQFAAGQPAAARSRTDWAGAGTAGDSASEDTWWQGESDIWWRAGDQSAGDADSGDDIDGLGELGELADADDVADGAWPEHAGPETDEAEADTGETDGRGAGSGGRAARSARRTPGSAGRDHGHRDGYWAGAGGPCGPEHEAYQPWFSPAASGDPWFAAGRQ